MTNEQTILGETITPDAVASDPIQTSEAAQAVQPTESYLSVLVGEGKKFADAETLARAKLDSDLHIKKLEEENKALRAKDTNYDLILAELEKKQQPAIAYQDQAVAVVVKDNNEELDQLIESRLTIREQKQIQNQNTKATWEALAENYGNLEAAKKVLAEFVKTKPYMKDVLDDLGRNNPAAALKEILAFKSPDMIGSQSNNPLGDLPQVGAKDAPVITWSEVNRIRTNDIKQYASSAFQSAVAQSIAHYQKQGLDYYKS